MVEGSSKRERMRGPMQKMRDSLKSHVWLYR